MQRITSEWFGSRREALNAADRLPAGFIGKARYALRSDGHHDWLLEIFAVVEAA